MNLIEINANEYVSPGKCSIHKNGRLYLNWVTINEFDLDCGRNYLTLSWDSDMKDRNLYVTLYPKYLKGTFRLNGNGSYPFYLRSERSAYLWSKGFLPRIQSVLGLETPNPLLVEVIR